MYSFCLLITKNFYANNSNNEKIEEKSKLKIYKRTKNEQNHQKYFIVPHAAYSSRNQIGSREIDDIKVGEIVEE